MVIIVPLLNFRRRQRDQEKGFCITIEIFLFTTSLDKAFLPFRLLKLTKWLLRVTTGINVPRNTQLQHPYPPFLSYFLNTWSRCIHQRDLVGQEEYSSMYFSSFCIHCVELTSGSTHQIRPSVVIAKEPSTWRSHPDGARSSWGEPWWLCGWIQVPFLFRYTHKLEVMRNIISHIIFVI